MYKSIPCVCLGFPSAFLCVLRVHFISLSLIFLFHLNIPNKFDKYDRNEALLFYKHIIDAVLEKAKYDNSSKVEEKELPKRICTGEPIPSLSLENDTYKIITNDNY